MVLADITSAREIEVQHSEFSIRQEGTKTTEQIISPDFDKWLAYFKEIPELNSTIERFIDWVIYGNEDTDIEFEDAEDKKRFENFDGFGRDNPEDIISNLMRTGEIAGSIIAELIRDRNGKVTNIKPLDPQTIKVYANERGFIEKFEQISAKPNSKGEMQTLAKWEGEKLKNIFYYVNNRIADEIVGVSSVEKLQKIIDFRHEAMNDLAEVFHRYINPFWIFYVDTDDEKEIEEFNVKVQKMIKKRDHLTVPKGTVDKYERLSIPQFSTFSPLEWIKHLERYFLMSKGIPETILGTGSQSFEASAREISKAWRTIVVSNQKRLEKAIKKQTGIKLKFPRLVFIEEKQLEMQERLKNKEMSNTEEERIKGTQELKPNLELHKELKGGKSE